MAAQGFTVMTAGMVVADIITAGIGRFAHQGEMMFVPNGVEVHIGGHPANIAIDLKKLGLGPEGIGVIAAVGRDVFGDFIEQTIISHRIRPFLQRDDLGTSKNMIFVIKGEDRRFHLDPGANLALSPARVKKLLTEHRPRVFCCRPGYSGMDMDMASIFRAVPNTLIVLDMCTPYNKPWEYIRPALPYVDVFHSNSGEAMETTGRDTVEAAVTSLLNSGIKMALITSGNEGAQLTTREFTINQPGFEVDAVDPTGAGDAFCAGFIKKILEFGIPDLKNLTPDAAAWMLLYAQAAGASCASAVGCTTGVSQEAVQNILNDQAENIRKNTTISRRDSP